MAGDDLILLPLGSARDRFLKTRQNESRLEDDRDGWDLYTHLQQSVRQFNADPSIIAIAGELARFSENSRDQNTRSLFLLAVCQLISEQLGNTRLPLVEHDRHFLRDMLQLLLVDNKEANRWDVRDEVDKIVLLVESGLLPGVIGPPDNYLPLVSNGRHVWTERMWRLEQRFSERIGAYCTSRPVDETLLRQSLAAVVGRKGKGGIVLNPRQRQAVAQAVQNSLCIISGGPGTGKTTIVVSILRLLARLGEDLTSVALAAPTGKAANRMEESIRLQLSRVPLDQWTKDDWRLHEQLTSARTLHRLLGFSPSEGTFRHHENNRLAETIVIVDEASMIDLYLMERLLRSLRDDARLILLGDSEQLPSVDAGAILRDLTQAAESPDSPLTDHVVRLNESMRMDPTDPQGRHILLVANHINAGLLPVFRAPEATEPENALIERTRVDAIGFQGVEFVEQTKSTTNADLSRRAELLQRWHQQFLCDPTMERIAGTVYEFGPQGFSLDDEKTLAKLYSHLARFRILCLTRTYRTGADAVNEEMHARVIMERKTPPHPLLPGEPIMMLQNDYDRMIFNGDQGIVLSIRYEGRQQLMAVFPRAGRFLPFHLEGLRGRTSLAYAMTVHKSQGSEFDHALLLLPETDLPINSRELLYTAITRCKRSITIFGDRAVFAQGSLRKIDRQTGIGDALAARPQ